MNNMPRRRLFRRPWLQRVRRGIVVCCLALAAASSAFAQPAVPAGISGTTVETAIVLPAIADEFHGVVAEHAYLAAHFPAWHIEYQTRVTKDDRDYDVLGMIKPDSAKVTIFFDITDWVGK